LLNGFQVHLVIPLGPCGMMREKKTKQTKRQQNASEGLVTVADQV
jgi:hypothetical protein